MASHQLDIKRTPLSQACANLALAEADLNGFVASISAGKPHDPSKAQAALDRVTHARHEIDRLRLATMAVERVNGCALSTNDPADMRTALLTALERIEEKPAPINTGYAETVSVWA